MQEEQSYQFISDKELVFETSTDAISMRDSFVTSSKWIISSVSENKCSVKIFVCAEYKGTWFKGTIENFIYEQSVSAYQQYVKMAKERVAEFIAMRSLTGNASTGDIPNGKEEITPEPKRKERRVHYEDDAESTGDEEFFDAMETPTSPSSGAIQQVTKEIDRLRAIIESTHTRLMGLEAAFVNMQDRYIPVTNKSTSIRERLNTYLLRLDATSAQIDKQKQEEESVIKKLEEIEKRLKTMNQGMTWLKGVSIAAFVIVWPFVATAAFKFVKAFLANSTKK